MKRNHRIRLITAAASCLFLLLWGMMPAALAQQSAGSVTGLVTDASGSTVAGAIVTVTDMDRGTTWKTQTTDAGLYNFPTIPVGRIQVKVEAPGFATAIRNAFTLVLDQVARVDFKLKIGEVNQTVTVNDIPPLLQTGSTEVGTIIDSKAAASLPLATRDVNQLTLLAPGVLSANIFSFESPQTTFGTGRPYVNGAREQDNNFLLDGMDINQPDNNDVAYTPSPDAISEFNIIVSNAAADYGNYAGGVIVESIKSGTNNFHGNVYEYLRNTDLNANTWQNKALAYLLIPDPNHPNSGNYVYAGESPRQAVQWNEFGGTIGGPIIKNKLFFFADEETSLYNQPKTPQTNSLPPNSNFYTPTTGQVSGQVYDLGWACTSTGGTFDASGNCSNAAGQLYMPSSSTAIASRPAIPYDQIPVSALDAVTAKLVALPEFQNEMSTNSYSQSGYTRNFQGDLRIDWQASAKDHIMGRYTQMYTHVIQQNGTDLLQPNLERQYPLKNIVVDYVRTITPTIVNDFRIGTQIFPADDEIYTSAMSSDVNSSIGLPDVPVPVLPSMIMGYGPGGSVGASANVEVFHDTTYQIEDSITWTKGRHSLHAGFQALHYAMNDTYAGNNGEAGTWTFNGQYTGNGGTSTGLAYADFLLGLPSQVGVGQPIHFNLVNSLFGGFVQDNYRALSNLTLNLGLRYEVVTPRGDRNSSKNINYDLATGAPQIGKNYDTYWGIGDVEPRVGFAWQLDPRTVLRGAYDISSYMEGNGISNMAVINPPNTTLINQYNTAGADLIYPANTLSNGYSPYQASCTAQDLLNYSAACLSGTQTHATDPHLRPAMNQQWNLTIQHQFQNNFTFSIGYVGDKDDHMSDIYWYNQLVLTSGTQQVTDASGATVTVPATAPGPYMQNLVTAGANARWNASDAISRYEAMEVTLSQKAYHGLDMQVNYTWSKCLSNSLGYFGSYGDEEGVGEQQNEGGGNFFQNEYTPKGDYGQCTIDASSAFNMYALYNLPFGRGRAFGRNVARGVDEVIGGWNVSFDTTFRSGFAVTAYDGRGMGSHNPASASALTAPSYVPRATCSGISTRSDISHAVQIGSSIGVTNLNPAAVSLQGDGVFGNCPVGGLRGPALKTGDMNLSKVFPVTEGMGFTFMAQFINLTNTPIFSIANTWDDEYSSCFDCTGVRTYGPNGGGAGSVGTYGLMDGSNPGREIELSLKFNF